MCLSNFGVTGLLAEHFRYDEDDEGSDKASASEEIDQRVTNSGKHWYCYNGSHRLMNKNKDLELNYLEWPCGQGISAAGVVLLIPRQWH